MTVDEINALFEDAPGFFFEYSGWGGPTYRKPRSMLVMLLDTWVDHRHNKPPDVRENAIAYYTLLLLHGHYRPETPERESKQRRDIKCRTQQTGNSWPPCASRSATASKGSR